MQLLQSYILQVEQALADNPYKGEPQNLYEPINYILSLGGKRVRPVLALMAYEMFAGNTDEKAMHTALAIEVFHNFTLVHDDIMDKAPLRRGKPTVHHKWNEPVAILAGDNMLIKAYEQLAAHDAATLKRLLPLFNRTATEVCEGQQMDMDFEHSDLVSEAEYIRMITLKTAVLLGCALSMGAMTAGASDEDAGHLYEYGKNIGIAFQLMDDYLDAFGNTEQTGKQAGGDIIAGKKTYLFIHAMQKASPEQRNILGTAYKNKSLPDGDKVNSVMAVFNMLNIEEAVRQQMVFFEQEAEKHLARLSTPVAALEPLRALTGFLKSREQ